MSSFGDLQAQVAADLRRSTIGPEISQAILDAIRDHDTRRFWFNDFAEYDFTLPTTTDTYTLAAIPPVLEFIRIDTVRARQGGATGSWYTVKPTSFTTIDELRSNPSSGQPARWSRTNNQLEIWPTSDKAYSMKIFGQYRLATLSAAGDSNVWTNEGKQLIRYTALKRLAAFPNRNADIMQLAEAMGTRELEYLRSETERRKRSGRMKAYG